MKCWTVVITDDSRIRLIRLFVRSVEFELSTEVPGDLFTVFIVMLNCSSRNTAPLKGPAARNIEVFLNEASASAVKVVVATVRAQAAQAHVSRKSQQ